jgi:hypothetical protein
MEVKRSTCLWLVVIVFCFGWIVFQCSSAYASERAIELDQVHTFMGRGQLIVSAKGIRLENKDKLKYTLVAKAPDWRVTIYRDDDKTYFSESLSEFVSTGLFSGFVLLQKERLLKASNFTKSSIKFLGRDAVSWTRPHQTLKCLMVTNLAPEAEKIIWAAYKTPTNGGLPLVFIKAQSGKDYTSGANQEGHMETILNTTKIENIDSNPRLFEAPSGYKLAKSLGVVFAGSAVRHDSVDFQSLFDMKPLGGRK